MTSQWWVSDWQLGGWRLVCRWKPLLITVLLHCCYPEIPCCCPDQLQRSKYLRVCVWVCWYIYVVFSVMIIIILLISLQKYTHTSVLIADWSIDYQRLHLWAPTLLSVTDVIFTLARDNAEGNNNITLQCKNIPITQPTNTHTHTYRRKKIYLRANDRTPGSILAVGNELFRLLSYCFGDNRKNSLKYYRIDRFCCSFLTEDCSLYSFYWYSKHHYL